MNSARAVQAVSICCLSVAAAGVAWPATFDADVAPILRANCMPCHDAATHTSGFVATNLSGVVAGGARRGQAVKPGDPGSSVLIKMLRGSIQPRMPVGKVLAESDVAKLEAWIRENSAEIAAALPKQQKWWAFEKPVRHDPPSVRE